MAEALRKIVEVHGAFLHRSLGRVMLVAPRNRARHGASGIFVRLRSRKYFFTAAHALENQSNATLLFGNVETVLSLKEAIHSYTRMPEVSEDVLDAAVVPVSDSVEQTIGQEAFLDIGGLQSKALYPINTRFLVLGFPSSRNKRPIPGTRLPFAISSGLITGLAERQEVRRHPKANGELNLVLGWRENSASDFSGKRLTPHALVGMSGGAIFCLGDFGDFDLLSGVAVPKPTLVGIFTRHIKEEEVLLGTRVNAIVDAMDRERAWP